ncbi:MAG TPA: glycosyltransferase family 4 protein, partial [Flavitalea sp.]|nr:glycosyltransferase family 4 protein [Flavitalea sp.]
YFLRVGITVEKLINAPHAVDNDRFSGDNDHYTQLANSLRSENGIEPGAFVFLFAGKLEEKKDPLLLARAFTAANFQASTHLVIAGNGHLEENLRSYCANHPRIHVLPFQNQSAMPALYRMANVFVLPSKGPGETWGLAVNEAMASGVAILMSDRCGGAPDLIKSGVNGYVFKAGDKSDLIEKMVRMSQNVETTAEMGKQSRRLIQSFTFRAVADAIQSTVDTITKKKKLFHAQEGGQ